MMKNEFINTGTCDQFVASSNQRKLEERKKVLNDPSLLRLDLEFDDDSDDWCDAYDEIDQRLFFSNVFYGLKVLHESTEEFHKNGLKVLATLTGDLKIINYDGDQRVLELFFNHVS